MINWDACARNLAKTVGNCLLLRDEQTTAIKRCALIMRNLKIDYAHLHCSSALIPKGKRWYLAQVFMMVADHCTQQLPSTGPLSSHHLPPLPSSFKGKKETSGSMSVLLFVPFSPGICLAQSWHVITNSRVDECSQFHKPFVTRVHIMYPFILSIVMTLC